jgi:hypothetical protein
VEPCIYEGGDIRLVEVDQQRNIGDWKISAGRRAYEAYSRELLSVYGEHFPANVGWDDIEGGAQLCWIAAATCN